ncbi:MAG: hypothetical protein ACT4P5_08255 [Armatimonadota bacterium]
MGIDSSMKHFRRFVTAFIPTALLLAWVARATATEAAFTGMLVGLPLTLVITLVASIRAARNSRGPKPAPPTAPDVVTPASARPLRAPIWPVILAGTVATAIYWFRVWSYPGMEQWELGGVLVLVYNFVGFWWPAVFVAMSAWLLEERLPNLMGSSPYGRRLGTGIVAGFAGIILFLTASNAYYEAYDRVPLEVDMARRVGHMVPSSEKAGASEQRLPVLLPCDKLQAPPPPVSPSSGGITISRSSPVPCAPPAPRPAPSPGVPYRLEAGHLTIELDGLTMVQANPYVALRSLEQAMESARGLLKRKDTAQLTLVVRMQQGDILRYRAGEADFARPVWELATFNRGLLMNGGRLELGSLAAMRETSVRADLQAFERMMRFQVAGDAVHVTFTPPGPLNADTAALYSSAWTTANKAVQEVVRYFPEIVRFHIDLAMFRTTVERSEAGTGFRLQHRVLRPDRILGMMIRRGDPKAHPADPAFHLFDPKSGLQAAVVVFDGPLDAHIPGLLFEEMILGPGVLYVLAIDADGTVTFLIGDENRLRGPITVPTAGEKAVEGSVITNLGWLDASRFERRRQK